MKDSQFVIGIDLGTTNSAVAYIDSQSGEELMDQAIFPVAQVVAAGQVEEREVIPSFAYLPGAHELPKNSLSLPWDAERDYCIGEFAREQGTKVPQRMISSAKSWLCHSGVDRNGAILPWNSPAEVERISPVEVSTRYLTHIREAWDHFRARSGNGESFTAQDIILTVPASFDAVARELTVTAARGAGFDVTLLEEPQAALYAWIGAEKDRWRKVLKVGDIILVCDIGGGTTDFSLISVHEEDGDLTLERIAVGDHILLGGDNMDLALAMTVQSRLKSEGTRLDSWQLQALSQSCRVAKEKILGDPDVASHPIVIPGRSSRLIGGSISSELDRKDMESVIIEGFFPLVKANDYPAHGVRVGLQELGLPFEADAAITRHIAKFLGSHQKSIAKHLGVEKGKKDLILPTAILFNGGVLKSPLLQKRILDVLKNWSPDASSHSIKMLEGTDLDLAVAKGAAYYGIVKRGKGIRIRGGTARSYYIGLETSMPAVPGVKPPIKSLCVAPQGMEEGTEAEVENRDFGLLVGQPALFRFLNSTTRPDDTAGTIVDDWDEGEIQELPPLTTELSTEGREGTVVPVRLHSHVTEVGTLELWGVEREGENRWKLEFDIREKEDA
jgi:molecular chaperone DnaK (HSP70)